MTNAARVGPARWRAVWVAAYLLAASPAPGWAQTGPKPPIKVGAVSSLALFPEATAAVRAYFDSVNAAGGIDGRRLVLLVEDDHADPTQASRAAQKLVETEQVVANVGSASALECSVNAHYYVTNDLVSIQGTGVDPVCFESPNISPVNAGPYVSTALALQFLTEVRQRDRVCVVTVNYAPIQRAAFAREIAKWSQRTRKQLTYSATGLAPDHDFREQAARAAQAGCNGVVFTAIESHVVEWMKGVRAKQLTGIDWVFLTPAYSENVIKTLGSGSEGIFAMSEFEPWSSRSGLLHDWHQLMTQAKVAPTSFSQGGYAAALVFVRALRSIRGEINRRSVTAALKTLQPQQLPLLGTPYAFGSGRSHSSNRANVPVQVIGGRWRVAHWEYIVAPPDQ